MKGLRRGPGPAGALACSLSLLATGCGGDDKVPAAPAQAAAKINVASFKFVPAAVTVATGGTVSWVNRDKAPHTAQNDGEAGPAQFNTRRLDTDESKSIPFAKPGVYSYYCIYHRFMRATVTVVK